MLCLEEDLLRLQTIQDHLLSLFDEDLHVDQGHRHTIVDLPLVHQLQPKKTFRLLLI